MGDGQAESTGASWNLFERLFEPTAPAGAYYGTLLLVVAAVGLAAYVAHLIARRFLLRAVRRIVRESRTQLDDLLVREQLFSKLSHLAPGLVVYFSTPFLPTGASVFIHRFALAYT